MTTTSQTEGAGESGKAPDTNQAPEKESKTVPLGEHIDLRKKLREVEERAAKAETALAAREKAPDPATLKAPGIENLQREIEAIKTQNRLRAVIDELGLADPKQAEKVASLMDSSGLNAREALAIMAKREPDAFAGVERQGGAEASFASLTPRPGSSPQPKRDEAEDRRKFVKGLKMTNRKEYNRHLDNQIGGHLADALGWEHKLLDIPQQP